MTVEEMAELLNHMPTERRQIFLLDLKDQTHFCWHCGCDYDSLTIRTCHCQNDE